MRALVTLGVAVLAFVARLTPVLRGGGLFGLGDYDDGVHYAAAAGLVHGRLPYRDFLFLHPPGIVLALAPFAALGRLIGDPGGFAAARVSWMLLGAVNAVLVMRIVGRQGRVAAVIGGVFYALFLPAVYGEHTTQLEGLATTCMLVALLILGSARADSRLWVAVAGAGLGVSTSIKIWGAAAVLIVLAWAWATGGRRRAGAMMAGAAAAATLICLPFFIAAPRSMMRMVVQDQLGRPAQHTSLVTRLTQIVGLPGHPTSVTGLLAVVLLAFGILAAAAALKPRARLAVALVVGLTVLLSLTPSWFLHYAALIAGPAAVTVGYGAAQLIARARRANPILGVVAAVALGVAVSGYAVPVTSARFGESFPGGQLAAAVTGAQGCVTTDNPTTLTEMGVLGRNLDRGCPLVIDLGGRSYDEPATPAVSRTRNPSWQRYALRYLESGTVVVLTRFSAGRGFSSATAATVKGWRVLHRIGRFSLRRVTGAA